MFDQKRYQVCNYILRVESKGSFDYISYYNKLHSKLNISRVIIYRSKTNLAQFIVYFFCDRRRDIFVDVSGKIISPKFFHIDPLNYPIFENENSFYRSAKIFENTDMYEIVHESENFKIDLNLNDHIKAFLDIPTYLEKLEYVESNSLYSELDSILRNVNAYNALRLSVSKENNPTSFPIEDASLKENNSTFPPTEAILEEIQFSPQQLPLKECLENDDKDLDKISFIFNKSNHDVVHDLLLKLKKEYDSERKNYSSLLKVSLIHFRLIKNSLRVGSKNQYLQNVFDSLPIDVKSTYQKYIDK